MALLTLYELKKPTLDVSTSVLGGCLGIWIESNIRLPSISAPETLPSGIEIYPSWEITKVFKSWLFSVPYKKDNLLPFNGCTLKLLNWYVAIWFLLYVKDTS